MQGNRLAGLKANAPWVGALLLLGLLPFLGVLFSGEILFASDQIGSPQWKFWFDALHRGEIPLWNGLALAGMPSLDALVGDASYPLFNIIGYLVPAERLHTWNFILHVLIAGGNAYFLVRAHFGLDRMLSLALGASYMLNTNFISLIYSGHTGKFFILAWLPLALFFLLRSLREDARWKHLLGLSLLIALFVTTSHLQFTYFVLMGFFLYWAYRTVRWLRGGKAGSAGLGAGKFWLPILLGLGLAFPLVYAPMQYNLNHSVRGEAPRKTLEHATSWSIHPEEAVGLVVPEFSGINEHYWGRNAFKLNSEYPGLAVLFLGLFGLLAFRKAWFWFWGSVGLLAIIYGLGVHTPLFELFYHAIPGVKNFRAPGMILFWLAASLLLMSAQALRLLSEDRASVPRERLSVLARKLPRIGYGAAAALVLCGIGASVVYSLWNAFITPEQVANFAHQARNHGEFAFGALKAGLGVAVLTWALKKWLLDSAEPRFFGAALLAVTLVDLYATNRHFIDSYELERFFPHEAAVDHLKKERAETGPFRVFGVGNAYPRGYMPYHGIETVDGWTDQEYALYRAYRGDDYHNNPNFMHGLKQNPDGTVEGSAFLDLLNVKYLAYRVPNDPGLKLAPNRSVLPRAWFASGWESDHDSLVLGRMKEPGFDPARSAYVSLATPVAPAAQAAPKTPPAPPSVDTAVLAAALAEAGTAGDSAAARAAAAPGSSPASAAPPAAIEETHRSNNRLVYDVDASAPGLLILSELWFPHWRVSVDGKPAEALRVNFAFRGVKLEPGKHRVEWRYRSPWLSRGLLATGGSLLLLLGGLALYRRLPVPSAGDSLADA